MLQNPGLLGLYLEARLGTGIDVYGLLDLMTALDLLVQRHRRTFYILRSCSCGTGWLQGPTQLKVIIWGHPTVDPGTVPFTAPAVAMPSRQRPVSVSSEFINLHTGF